MLARMTRTPQVGTEPADTRRATATTIESGGIEAIPPERRHGLAGVLPVRERTFSSATTIQQ